MEIKERRIVLLELDNGKVPFQIWFNALKDKVLQKAVDARIVRLSDSNFGDHKAVGGGVFELRIPKGPGLRIYYGLKGNDLVLVLGGGDKSSQQRDIQNAKRLWSQFKNEN